MEQRTSQAELFPVGLTVGAKIDDTAKETQKALDQLFTLTQQYQSSASLHALLSFVGRFRFYSPYNSMLIHVQMPGATFVAPPHRWLSQYSRHIRTGARPIVILKPKGPVMFVFDVSDTEAEADAPPLPAEVINPFEVSRGHVEKEWDMTIENAKRDGVRCILQAAGSQSAGSIRSIPPAGFQDVFVRRVSPIETKKVQIRYDLLINKNLSRPARFATMTHELAHLYCGHLGTSDSTWWPDRAYLPLECREFEAESICYLVCTRLGIDNPSEAYLQGHLRAGGDVPPISLEAVMSASGLIERMGRQWLPLRKPGTKP